MHYTKELPMLPESLPTQSDSNSHHSHHGQTWRICYHNLMSSSNVSVARWTPPKKNTAFGHPDPAGPPTTRHCQHLPWWTAIRFCWLYQHPGAKGKLGTFLQRKMEKSINLLLCQDVDIVKDIYIYIYYVYPDDTKMNLRKKQRKMNTRHLYIML